MIPTLCLFCLLGTQQIDAPSGLPVLYLPAQDFRQQWAQITYHIPRASAERAEYEAELIHLLHENLAKEQAGILDMDLRRKIRRLEVKIEAAQ